MRTFVSQYIVSGRAFLYLDLLEEKTNGVEKIESQKQVYDYQGSGAIAHTHIISKGIGF
jgi:hypothetical protein